MANSLTTDDVFGHVIDERYRIEEQVGAGGMGSVYRGVDIRTSKEVAIKIIKKELCENQEVLRRFETECSVVRELEHPNTLRMLDFGSLENGRRYLVMEYLRGSPLNKRLREPDFDLAACLEMAQQVCRSLSEAHDRGIVHRDLKPHNIFMQQLKGGSYVARVLDFGIAKLVHEPGMTSEDQLLGTVAYVSPEQAKGHPVDSKSDLYSLGIILYECITGKVPFKGNVPYETLMKQVNEAPEPISERGPRFPCPPELEELILQMLHKPPSERPGSATEVERRLRLIEATVMVTHSQVSAVSGTGVVPTAPDAEAPSGSGPIFSTPGGPGSVSGSLPPPATSPSMAFQGDPEESLAESIHVALGHHRWRRTAVLVLLLLLGVSGAGAAWFLQPNAPTIRTYSIEEAQAAPGPEAPLPPSAAEPAMPVPLEGLKGSPATSSGPPRSDRDPVVKAGDGARRGREASSNVRGQRETSRSNGKEHASPEATQERRPVGPSGSSSRRPPSREARAETRSIPGPTRADPPPPPSGTDRPSSGPGSAADTGPVVVKLKLRAADGFPDTMDIWVDRRRKGRRRFSPFKRTEVISLRLPRGARTVSLRTEDGSVVWKQTIQIQQSGQVVPILISSAVP